MTLRQAALDLQARGRGPDTQLVHMAPAEVAGLQQLAEHFGGSLTTNPETGLPEAGFLEDILPMVVGAATMFVPGMQGVGAYLLAGGAGGLTSLLTADEGDDPLLQFARGALGGVGGMGMGTMAAGMMGTQAASQAGLGALGETAAATAGTGTLEPMVTGATGAESLLAAPSDAQTYDALRAFAEAGEAQYPVTAATSADVVDVLSPLQRAQYEWNTGLDGKVRRGISLLGQANKAGLLGASEEPPRFAPAMPAPAYNPAQVELQHAQHMSSGAPQWARDSAAAAPGGMRAAPLARPASAFARRGFESFPSERFAQGGVAGMESGAFVFPADVVSALGNGSTDAGLRALAPLGAQPIRGPGDGQSDDIPARIDGARPARVADGEAYLSPADVARLGGGNHSLGARKLYDMMARVRRQAHGHTEQQRPVDPNAVLA